jgi:hypothetical protein
MNYPLFVNPFVSTTLALRMAEMMWASAQVISIRTTRAMVADPRHRARDSRELAMMGQEKLEAAGESFARMGAYWTSLGMQFAMFGWNQWMAMSKAMLPTAGSSSLTDLMGQQSRLVQTAMQGNAKLAAAAMQSGAKAAQHGLKPIHARATRNARRLSK